MMMEDEQKLRSYYDGWGMRERVWSTAKPKSLPSGTGKKAVFYGS
jgi:hypothetical protein